MKKILFLLCILLASINAQPLDDLLNDVIKDTKEQKSIDKKRETEFLTDLNKAKKLLSETKQALINEKQRTENLKTSFEKQKSAISHYRNELDNKSVNLKDLFAMLKQESRDFSSLLKTSMTSAELKNRDIFLEKLSHAGNIPNIDDIKKFLALYLQEIIESGKIKTFVTQVVDINGNKSNEDVTRVGLFSAFNDKQYLRYDDSLQAFVSLVRQPDSEYLDYIEEYKTNENKILPVLIDPTRGVLFSMLKEKATIQERIMQGGIIGYIILLLGGITILFAFYKYFRLFNINAKINKQLNNNEAAEDNPLGRILLSFNKHQSKDIATIESKMDTAILKEIPEIQSGLPMIKLVAAVAPLLGLLGTVTGMIETFQSITLFGTGDPKLMAGGISQALMTTVLGLVVAIPVLFIFSILTSQSKRIIEILTQQSSTVVAKQLEMINMDIKSHDQASS